MNQFELKEMERTLQGALTDLKEVKSQIDGISFSASHLSKFQNNSDTSATQSWMANRLTLWSGLTSSLEKLITAFEDQKYGNDQLKNSTRALAGLVKEYDLQRKTVARQSMFSMEGFQTGFVTDLSSSATHTARFPDYTQFSTVASFTNQINKSFEYTKRDDDKTRRDNVKTKGDSTGTANDNTQKDDTDIQHSILDVNSSGTGAQHSHIAWDFI